jgi:ribonuclease P protein subunit POP4
MANVIGATLEVVDAKNKSLIGKKGTIIDETKNTFVIQNTKKEIIVKNSVTLKINEKTIDGKTLIQRPYEG